MILIILFTVTLTYFSVSLWRARQKNPEGPAPLPLIGNLHQLIYNAWKTRGIVSGFHEFRKQYGKVFTIWLGPIPTIHITDYDLAYDTHVKKSNLYGDRFVFGGMQYIREGRGIIGSNGDFWLEHRRFALHTLRNFGLGRNIMEEKIMDEYRYRVQDFSKTNGKNGVVEVQAATYFDLLVGSIINQLLISERFEQNDIEFENLKLNLTKSLEEASLFDSFCPVWVLKSDWMKWRTKTTLAPFDYIFEVVRKNIQKRVVAIEEGSHVLSEEGDDFVDAFLIKMEKDKKDQVDSTFNLETLAVDLFDLWTAGQETTSTTLTWACVCLLNHPEVVEKLRSELVQITGGHRSLSLTDRAHTPYLMAVIAEVQRIASILNVNIFRVLPENTVIDGHPAASGSAVSVQMALIHTDETLFESHTEFRPERFLLNESLEKKMMPFGIGKRACPGESLARAELYLILGNLVMNYDLEPVGALPAIRTISPFGIMKRPPVYNIRFVPVI